MTVIAVRKFKDHIEISGDTQSTFGGSKIVKKDNTDRQVKTHGKLFQVNEMTIGCAGNVSEIGLLRRYAKTNRPKEMEQDDIIDWIFEFKDWANKKADSSKNNMNFSGILIFDKKIFSFCDDNEVYEIRNFDAVGSGMSIALGVMENGASPQRAVEIAIKYDLYCGGESTTLKIKL